jgi:hypothetical protein
MLDCLPINSSLPFFNSQGQPLVAYRGVREANELMSPQSLSANNNKFNSTTIERARCFTTPRASF